MIHELCPTCLRPASLRKAAEIDIHSRQAEADRLNAFVDELETAVCGAIGADPVAVRLASLEAENKGLRDRFSDADTERNVAQGALKAAFARVAELEARCKRLEKAGDAIVDEYMVVDPEKSAWKQAKEAKP